MFKNGKVEILVTAAVVEVHSSSSSSSDRRKRTSGREGIGYTGDERERTDKGRKLGKKWEGEFSTDGMDKVQVRSAE